MGWVHSTIALGRDSPFSWWGRKLRELVPEREPSGRPYPRQQRAYLHQLRRQSRSYEPRQAYPSKKDAPEKPKTKPSQIAFRLLRDKNNKLR
jgi:hypothetical protein